MLDVIPSQDGFQARVRLLVADGEIPPKLGKELMQLHQSALSGSLVGFVFLILKKAAMAGYREAELRKTIAKDL